MRVRVLKEKEWPELGDLDMAAILPFVKPENIRIVVVESDEGQIVATWAAIRQVEFEGIWIHPEHRNAGVIRGLLQATKEAAKEWANSYGVTWSKDPVLSRQIERMGGKRFEAETYFLPMEVSCQ